ncbi:MAG: hypothetical protein EKK56_00830 [Flavobacteriaceae bacterium]|nr:MAG: hypothetical protein EKK56_00830 [Flavobacteriaceae bacterium]
MAAPNTTDLSKAENYKKSMKKPQAHSPIPRETGQPKSHYSFQKGEVHQVRHKIDGKPYGKEVQVKSNGGKGFGEKKGQ